jgi:hypothetical protein
MDTAYEMSIIAASGNREEDGVVNGKPVTGLGTVQGCDRLFS